MKGVGAVMHGHVGGQMEQHDRQQLPSLVKVLKSMGSARPLRTEHSVDPAFGL